ncbi:MAG: cereblon family protein, partial [Myxococcota bacterium]|nr:cereblon family protein [Myxococcota bacterium]
DDRRAGRGRASPGTSPDAGAPTGDDDALRCTVCDHRITERAYGSERAGAHEHTFVNPGGIVHTIGCFVAAPGCGHVGPAETAFSWFPGWSWQVAVCAQCRTHVGWAFRCPPEQFHGLIRAALH